MKYITFFVSLVLFCTFSACKKGDKTNAEESRSIDFFEPNLKSLSKHKASPEWFTDAKLGIYFHW